MDLVDFFLTPISYPFMLRGLIATLMAGVVCATVGTFVVLRGMAFFGDALAHSILPGVAIGYLVSGGAGDGLFWWGTLTAVLTSVGIGTLTRGGRVKEDSAIGIIFAGMFALGIALISTRRTTNVTVDLTHFLFGHVLGVSNSQLTLIAIFGLGIILLIVAFYKEFLILTFDPVLATTLRLPKTLLEYLLLILIALAIVVSLQTVGVALMMAMLVTPAATAYLLTRRLPVMMVLAALIASASGVIGLYCSYYLQVASGAAIVLVATLFFGLAWSVQTLRQRRLRG